MGMLSVGLVHRCMSDSRDVPGSLCLPACLMPVCLSKVAPSNSFVGGGGAAAASAYGGVLRVGGLLFGSRCSGTTKHNTRTRV